MHSPIVHQPHEKPDHVYVRMQPVDSSTIRRLGYNRETQQLVVHFHDSLPGLRTVYSPVPEEVYREFTYAESMGRFLDEQIRYTYDFALLSEERLLDPDDKRDSACA